MNIGTSAAHKRSSEVPRPSRYAGSQLSLPLEVDSQDEDALRAAWTRCGLRMPYHVALQNRPLAICLSCLADAMRRKACTEDYSADGKRGSNRRGK
jgi:hypothetical protein